MAYKSSQLFNKTRYLQLKTLTFKYGEFPNFKIFQISYFESNVNFRDKHVLKLTKQFLELKMW